MKHKRIAYLFIFMMMLLIFSPIIFQKQIKAFSPQVIQHGAVGDDVIELQARLKHIGFYTGEINGVFDWRTYWALRHFQYEFGMDIDSMAGAKTKDILTREIKNHGLKEKDKMYKKIYIRKKNHQIVDKQLNKKKKNNSKNRSNKNKKNPKRNKLGQSMSHKDFHKTI